MPAFLNETAKGVYAIATTPFSETSALDYNSVESLANFYLEQGVHGLTVLGVMGEAPKLTDSEQLALIKRYIKRINGRIPVLVGVSNPGIDNLVSLSKASMDAGAQGVMIAGVPSLKTDKQILGYFSHIITKLDDKTPVCLQDYPPNTTVHFSTSTINKLINDYTEIKMFKHEDCPGHQKLTKLRNAPKTDGLRRVSILTGNGALYIPQELRRGADGVMTGLAFIGALVEVYNRFVDGEPDRAEDLFDIYLPLIRHEQQFGFGLALRKETLRRMGALMHSSTRAPGPVMDKDDITELEGLFTRLRQNLEYFGKKVPPGI